MPLESASFISQLDTANPAGADALSQADDHIRLIKAVLKSTFPNIDSQVTASPNQLNALASGTFPVGGIVVWYGDATNVPSGWALCNGQTVNLSAGGGTIKTPDLRDRFVLGGGAAGVTVGSTGGSLSKSAEGSSIPFSLQGSTNTAGAHSHGGSTAGHAISVDQMAPHSHEYQYTNAVGKPTPGTGSAYVLTVSSNTPAQTDIKGSGNPHAHQISQDGAHSHTFNVTGSFTPAITIADARPPYLVLCYIMKI